MLCAVICLFSTGIKAQDVTQINISSVVYDEKGNPVEGAIISGNQGKTVAYSDKAGKFLINVPINSDVVITAKGFRTQTVKATAGFENIILAGNDAMYNEVYLPFTKINKKDVAGAISTLNPETYIDQDFNLSVTGGMNGRVAGMLWSNNIWGLENAIVIIDGIRREFTDISFNEVQQISVLKGINAVALYGSQAAKGVIFITTKKGEVNGRKIGIRVNSGVALPSELPNYLNSSEYMTLYNEARNNDGLTNLYDATTIQNHASGNPYRYPSVDYYSSQYLKKHQNATDANAEFSGGNRNARFYSNIGWSNSSTLLNIGEGKNENDNRLNVRGNVDLKLNEHISSSVYVSAIFSESRRARGNYWSNAATLLPNRFTPLIPIDLISPNDKTSLALVAANRNLIDGKYLLGGAQQFLTNPIADLYVAGYDMNIRRVFQVTNEINASLNSVIKGLSFHTLFNLDYANSYLQSINNTYAVYAPTWSATADTLTRLQKFGEDARPGIQNINNTTQRQNIGFSSWFGYDKTVAANHNISAKLLGFTSSVSVNDVYQPITNSHIALQLGYNYKHKYWVDFSAAYVNSTKLPEGNRAAFSPTFSLGWLLSSEKFLARAKAINHLKLSASGGILNTDLDISGYYLYENIYQRGSFFTWNDGVQAQNQATAAAYGASPNLGFPRRKEVNASVEAAFFNNLLTMQSTFFITEMDGLLTQRFSQYPNYFSSFIPYTNYNAYKRSGFDLMLNVNKQLGDVQLSLGTNLVYTKSTVTKRDELFLDSYQNRNGKPLDAIFGLQNAGFFMDQADINNSPRQLFSEVKPGDLKYVDQNGDNVIDSRDEVMIGRYIAPFTYGINFSVAYKNFNLFVLGTGNNDGYGLTNNNYYWVSGDLKYSDVVRNRWTEATKTTATYPRLSSQQNNNNFRSSDFWVYKTDRFNLSKVQLTYNFSNTMLRHSFVKGLLVYVSGSNLYTFAQNRKILELSVASTPQFRSYNAGIRAQF
ncbi:SusC/RagA family TonB-linked outer membrane protein [Lacibacter luteus]|nr:SusC/RagA family TonB-linked outer membrane protein [Lacibacter luteus]